MEFKRALCILLVLIPSIWMEGFQINLTRKQVHPLPTEAPKFPEEATSLSERVFIDI